MRRFMTPVLAAEILLLSGLAWAQRQVGSRRPTPVLGTAAEQKRPAMKALNSSSLSPASITFSSSTPDNTQANSSTKITLKVTANPSAFHVYGVASAANFSGCNNPPVSSITATCGSPSGVSCAGAVPLTDAASGFTLATGSGSQPNASFTVTLTFQDSWVYSVGSSCTVNVSYYYSEP